MNSGVEKITIFPGFDKFGEREKFGRLEIARGEIVSIVGPTGAGKSQLLYDIEKLAQGDTKSKRKVLINNVSPGKKWKSDPRRKIVASLSQSMDFLTDTSVGEFLDMHLKARGRETEASLIKEVIDEANEITGEPISAKMNLLSLSGGQSRALMVSDIANITVSPIILIDEIENAGIKKSKALQILIEEEKIVLIVTHDPSLALSADKRLVVENGGIVRVLDTAPQEKDIAHYLNWIEEHNLRIREKVRQGEVVEEPGIYCVEPTKFRNIELKN